jgi:hypothetical protein
MLMVEVGPFQKANMLQLLKYYVEEMQKSVYGRRIA